MGWFFGKKESVEDDVEEGIRICQGCGLREDEEDDKTKLRKLRQQTSDGKYEFLFCRKCYRMMKKGKMPPLISQMQAQNKNTR